MGSGEIQSEADALHEIVSWSKDRPAWQRDALRRLVTNGSLSQQDIDDLTAICKAEETTVAPLEDQHVTAQRTGAPTVALKSLRDVQNVNALAENQSLNFIPTGVTIVYGDNGSGKSGYVRVLKQACRARTSRGRDEQILPNIYSDQQVPQRAQLEYLAGGQEQKTEWKDGSSMDALLSEISVFDSRAANVHVEETNDLAYTPYPMKVLERLVDACRSVKNKLDAEVTSLRQQTPKSISQPACTGETEVGKLIQTLGKDTKPQRVETLAILSETELSRLSELSADFSQDPKATAARLRAQKERLEVWQTALQNLEDGVSEANATQLGTLAEDARAKAEAARLASEELFQSEPLSGVGSNPWRALWEAARAYSVEQAYPEKLFPVVEGDARCVLCHQELDADAAARLSRFEAFVQDRTQQKSAQAQTAYDQLTEQLRAAAVSQSEILKIDRALRNEFGNPELAGATRAFTTRAKWRLRDILRRQGPSETAIPSLADTQLKEAIDALDSRITAVLAAEDDPERQRLRHELNSLKDRQWLRTIKDDVLAEIERRKTIANLESAIRNTRPNEITAKNTALSNALVTERLRARFAQEVDHLNLAGLAIELTQTRSQHGISRFRISLMQNTNRNAGDILSEGEYRCVALSGFLAELATNNSQSGIIFDDPVSSLDHLHREAIAKRLAEEGRKRQVVVFTHDLPFLFLLRNACVQVDDPAQKTEIALRHIQKRSNQPGYCRNEAPDKAQPAHARLKSIRKHLQNTRALYEKDPDGTDWLITARGIVDSLRQIWEAAVEDAISPVLRTFSSKVDTKGFSKLSAITEQDAKTMRYHYGECSVLLHKASDAMNPAAPTPERIEQELDALETWLHDVSDRQSRIRAA